MPENWKTYKLEEILEALIDYRGKTPKKTTQGIPLVTAKIVKQGRIQEPNEFIAKKDYETWMRRGIPKVGDVVLTTEAPLGEVAQIKDANIALAQRIVTLRGKKGVLDSSFLKYFLQSNTGQSRLEARQSGTTVFGIKQSELRKVLIDCPTFQEQKSIASILSALDDKIELNLQMNKTLEEMAMALYKHWFVDFGPFQEGEFIESELRQIPKGWEIKTVQDFGRVITGKTPSKKFPEHFGEEIPFVTPTDFKSYGRHITTAARGISQSGIEKHKNSILPQNSVIVTCIGSDMGKVAVNKVRCLTNQQINSLITEHYHYLYLFFKSNYEMLKMLAGDGTTMPIINKTSFQNINVILPPQNILKKFETQIQDWDEQMHLNTIENQTLTQLRDTLLPKLISGEVRVKDVEKTLTEVL